MRRALLAALVVSAGLLGAGRAQAQAIQNIVLRNSFNPVGAGARGLGMGGAFIAVADDGTAASFNPAGLAQLRRTELAVVGFSDQLTSTVRVPEGATLTGKVRHQAPDFVGLAIPFEAGDHSLTVQLSYQRAVDLFGRGQATLLETVDLDDVVPGLPGTGQVIADVTPDQSGAFHTATVSAGYEATSRLSLGASINYWVAEWTAQGASRFRLLARLPNTPRPVEVPLFENEFFQEQSLRGLNLNAGFLLKFPRLSVGGVLRLPFTGDYGLRESDTIVIFDQGRPRPAESFDLSMNSRMHWPRGAGMGVALRPFRGLTLAGDYSRSHWSRTFIEDVPGGALLTDRDLNPEGVPRDAFTDRNFFDLLPASQTATVDTDQWRGGIEYLLTIPKVVVPFRAGVFRDRSPVAELTGEGRQIEGITFGTGLNFSRIVLDVAFERRKSEGVVALRLRGGLPAGQQGPLPTETVRQDRIVASLIYRAGGDDDPLKRLVRYLFVGSGDKEGN